mmetsp:Transcript_131365/g.319214  ORF Transcript_131365/g.319214 Transcript_131365/m.319214 type:complete len:328 (-) Transcript_131365:39-1022(-)
MFTFARGAARGAAGALAVGAGAFGVALAPGGAVGAAGESKKAVLDGYEAADDRSRLRAALAIRAMEGSAIRGPLHPKETTPFKVVASDEVSHDTRRIRLVWPNQFAPTLGLVPASCVVANATIDGEEVNRPYTPVSPANAPGYVELIVKSYGDKGKMSTHMCNLRPGDIVKLKGPYQSFEYEANSKKYIGMVAGGSGVTPMLQLLNAILKNPRDNTEVRLLFSNKSEADILLREELEVLQFLYSNFKVVHTITKDVPEGWTGLTGVVSERQVRDVLPPPTEDTLICVCGPPGFMKHVSGERAKDRSQGELSGVLKSMGYTEDMVFKF